MSPHTSSLILTLDRKPKKQQSNLSRGKVEKGNAKRPSPRRRPPKYLVLDLMNVSNLDASATRGTFLQLVKMCAKRNIVVCASGLTPRMEWMFRSHDVSLKTVEEEESFKANLLSRSMNTPKGQYEAKPVDCILLFVTVQEALEFCETALIKSLNISQRTPSSLSLRDGAQSLTDVLSHILGTTKETTERLARLEDGRYHDEVELKSGDLIFQRETHPDSFYIVLQGCVANSTSSSHVISRQQEVVVSGAGVVQPRRVTSSSNLFDEAFIEQNSEDPVKTVATLWPVGGIFGYLDFLLERPRVFRALATQDGTRVARFSQSHMNLMQTEDPELYGLIQRVLLHASSLDLRNCTCNDV